MSDTYEEYHVIPSKNVGQQGPDVHQPDMNNVIADNQGRKDPFVVYKAITTYTPVKVFNNGPGSDVPVVTNPPIFTPHPQGGVFKVKQNGQTPPSAGL